MNGTTVEADKRALRAEAHRRRFATLPAWRVEASAAAVQHFLSNVPLQPGSVVAGFWPIRDELDIRPLLARLMDSGHRLCLPAVVARDAPLEFREWAKGGALYDAGFGTLAPDADAAQLQPDVMLLPLLGFDRHGTRLGYGGGYYDRTLAALPQRPRLIGFAFACQEFDHIPRDSHDVPLDGVVTEAGARLFCQG